jgi:hypothetical protein
LAEAAERCGKPRLKIVFKFSDYLQHQVHVRAQKVYAHFQSVKGNDGCGCCFTVSKCRTRNDWRSKRLVKPWNGTFSIRRPVA